jgi:formylglycine-generating enzyme required for sulfatase activity
MRFPCRDHETRDEAVRILLSWTCAFLLGAPASAVTIDWVAVGDAGNTCETQSQGCFGAVAYDYQIAKYEVTNAQYTEFLNAVADTDTNALYSTTMDSSTLGGITRSGSSGSFSYSVKTGFADKPVNFVSFYDSLRFANWLENGQPTGAQGNATTEDGAYTITAAGILANSITRNTGATIFLTSEDEWYKAAYYNAITTSYFDYTGSSNVLPTCAAPTGAANSANCDAAGTNATDADVDAPTIVGSFTGTQGPFGTFDQGGNVTEWNETISGTSRGLRGGSFGDNATVLAASFRFMFGAASQFDNVGFRVASLAESVPEPATGLLVLTGGLGLVLLRRKSQTRQG